MDIIVRKQGRQIFRFVGLNESRQMVKDGFKGPFYGRVVDHGLFEDNVLFGNHPIMLDGLYDPSSGLATEEQYNKFYNRD